MSVYAATLEKVDGGPRLRGGDVARQSPLTPNKAARTGQPLAWRAKEKGPGDAEAPFSKSFPIRPNRHRYRCRRRP